MVSFTLLTGAMLAGVAVAQSPNSSFNSSEISTVLGEIGPTMASSWCNAQYNACGILCSGSTAKNNCDPKSLNYTCTCSSNSSAPALQYYEPTMLSLVCNQALGDCLKNNAGSQAEQDNCKSTIVCGSLNVTAFQGTAAASSSSVASSASATGTPSASATGSGTAASSTPTKGAAAYGIDNTLATGVFGSALLAIMGMVL